MDELQQAELVLIDAHIEQVKQSVTQCEKIGARGAVLREKLQERLEQLQAYRDQIVARGIPERVASYVRVRWSRLVRHQLGSPSDLKPLSITRIAMVRQAARVPAVARAARSDRGRA